MTALLLDSAPVIWLLTDSPRLGPDTRRLITHADAVYASSVTVAELTIKSMLGRLGLPDGFASTLGRQGLRDLPLTSAHAEGVRQFPELIRHDPFDRLLLAQAVGEHLNFVTSDRVLLGLGRDDVLDATR